MTKELKQTEEWVQQKAACRAQRNLVDWFEQLAVLLSIPPYMEYKVNRYRDNKPVGGVWSPSDEVYNFGLILGSKHELVGSKNIRLRLTEILENYKRDLVVCTDSEYLLVSRSMETGVPVLTIKILEILDV